MEQVLYTAFWYLGAVNSTDGLTKCIMSYAKEEQCDTVHYTSKGIYYQLYITNKAESFAVFSLKTAWV